MNQPPRALGLFFCDQVLFERETDRPTLVGLFDSLRVAQVPTVAPRFDDFAALTDGRGTVAIDLVVTSLRTDEQVYGYSAEVAFPDPFRIVHTRISLAAWEVPDAGVYLFSLLGDGEELAHRRLTVRLPED